MITHVCLNVLRGGGKPTFGDSLKPFKTPLKLSCLVAFSALALVSGCDDINNKSVKSNDELCKEVDCSGHGTCAVDTDRYPVCVCDNGYHITADDRISCVENGTSSDACEDVTCSNHGTCAVKSGNSAICICDSGYHLETGKLTECKADEPEVSPCNDEDNPIDCGTGGICAVQSNGNAVCICGTGYHLETGNLTECIEDAEVASACADKDPTDENEDDPVDCGTGGVCAVQANGGAICICETGYHLESGNLTECIQDEEVVSACADKDPTDENEDDPVDCGTGGVCAIQANGEAICVCGEGYHLETSNLTECIQDDVVVSPCADKDPTDENDNDPVDCGTGGICAVQSNGEAICICGTGYHLETGNMTECKPDDVVVSPCADKDPSDENEDDPVDCGTGGVCAVQSTNGEAICVCGTGYHLETGNLTECKKDDEVVSPCADKDPSDENPNDPVDCDTGGICAVNPADNTAVCICGPGFEQDATNPAHCISTVDPCNDTEHPVDCGTDGVCAVKDGTTAVCICGEGFHLEVGGSLTECKPDVVAVSPCNDTEHPVDCGTDGVCAVKDDTTAVCICGEGFHLEVGGSLTECKPDVVAVSPCNDTEHPVDCNAGGICAVKDDTTPVCICGEGYHLEVGGSLTECKEDVVVIPPCNGVDCGTNGICAVKDDTIPVCICGEGFHLETGSLTECKPDEVVVSPCAAEGISCGNGVCAVRTSTDTAIDNTAICICEEGYHVTTTNLTECVADPFSKCDDPNQDGNKADKVTCSNAGICAIDPTDNNPKCICNPGYHQSATDATICEADENPCTGVDCGTNGECVVEPSTVPGEAGTAVCLCGPGYKQNDTNHAQCDNICDGIDCNAGGSCAVNPVDNTPICLCGEGYHQNDTVVTQCDLDTDWCAKDSVDCGGYGTCMNAKDKAVCICNDGYHATVEEPTNCIETVLPNPCDGVTCNDKGYCLISYPNNAQCVCETGFSNRLPTECIESGADNNSNYMLDIYETASDQGTDCLENRNGCSDFCDSFMGYKCSTKCTEDSQCTTGYVCRTDGRCAPEAFETVWYAKTANATINLPTLSVYNTETNSYDCDFNINWGDGKSDHVTNCSNYMTSHTYSNTSERSYNIKVTGKMAFTCENTVLNNGSLCQATNQVYLTEVKSFGQVVLLDNAFNHANQLTKVSSIDIPIIGDEYHSMQGMFNSTSQFKDPDEMLNKWDTSGVTIMSSAFSNTSAFNSPINHWDTSSVIDMHFMFSNAKEFNQPLNDWDTSNVTNMSQMFTQASKFNQPLDNWNTSKVTDMNRMFFMAIDFDQPLNNWNTSKVENMSYMFAWSAFNQSISNWDTSRVTNMSRMFYNCVAFNQPLTKNGNKWNTSNVTDMSGMFMTASSFDQDLNSWDTSSVTNMSGMFNTAEVFNHSISNWDTHNVTDMSMMFRNAKAFNQPLTTSDNKWNTSNVTTMSQMFNGAELFDQDLNSWNTSNVTDMNEMFSGASEFHHSLENWIVTQVSSYTNMFLNTAMTRGLWQTMKANTTSGWADKDFSKLGLPATYNE